MTSTLTFCVVISKSTILTLELVSRIPNQKHVWSKEKKSETLQVHVIL